jgi:hypothetical protein
MRTERSSAIRIGVRNCVILVVSALGTATPGRAQTIVGNPAATQTITQPTGTNLNVNRFENIRFADQFSGTDCGAKINSADADLSTNPGEIWVNTNCGTSWTTAVNLSRTQHKLRIFPGNYTIGNTSAPTTVPITLAASNVDIECSPNNATILKASASLTAVMIAASSVSNLRIAGCVIDGNKGSATPTKAIVFSGVTKSKIIGNHFQNFTNGRLLHITNGSNFNTIQDNEIDHYGNANQVGNGNEAIALEPVGTGAGVQENDIIHNHIHDGNAGIFVYNSNSGPGATTNTARNRIIDNRIESNYNDAITLFNDNGTSSGSLIQGTIIARNVIRCNGWPANGTGWDSTNCPPGAVQSISTTVGQGVGINLNSSLQDQTQVLDNRSEFNFYEGGDDTPQTHSTVNTSNGAIGLCSSNCVHITSGDNLLTTWKTSQAVFVNGTYFLISSVNANGVDMSLTTAPGTQAGVALIGYGYSRSIWNGNYFYNNGNGAPAGGQGAGLAIQGGGVTSNGNIAVNNAYSGFYDQAAVSVTHDGDHAIQNCRVANCNEFNEQAVLRPTHTGTVADARNGSNALFWDPDTSFGWAESPSMCSPSGCGAFAVQDQGAGDHFSDGGARGASNTNGGNHVLCWNSGGGTGCINYGGGAGGFTQNIPNSSGLLLGTGQNTTFKSVHDVSVGCTTAAGVGTNCTGPAISWPGTAFADSQYSIACVLVAESSQLHITSVNKSAGSFAVRIANDTTTGGTANVDCTAVHQ